MLHALVLTTCPDIGSVGPCITTLSNLESLYITFGQCARVCGTIHCELWLSADRALDNSRQVDCASSQRANMHINGLQAADHLTATRLFGHTRLGHSVPRTAHAFKAALSARTVQWCTSSGGRLDHWEQTKPNIQHRTHTQTNTKYTQHNCVCACANQVMQRMPAPNR